jgi:hypothetical protein
LLMGGRVEAGPRRGEQADCISLTDEVTRQLVG